MKVTSVSQVHFQGREVSHNGLLKC